MRQTAAAATPATRRMGMLVAPSPPVPLTPPPTPPPPPLPTDRPRRAPPGERPLLERSADGRVERGSPAALRRIVAPPAGHKAPGGGGGRQVGHAEEQEQGVCPMPSGYRKWGTAELTRFSVVTKNQLQHDPYNYGVTIKEVSLESTDLTVPSRTLEEAGLGGLSQAHFRLAAQRSGDVGAAQWPSSRFRIIVAPRPFALPGACVVRVLPPLPATTASAFLSVPRRRCFVGCRSSSWLSPRPPVRSAG